MDIPQLLSTFELIELNVRNPSSMRPENDLLIGLCTGCSRKKLGNPTHHKYEMGSCETRAGHSKRGEDNVPQTHYNSFSSCQVKTLKMPVESGLRKGLHE